MNGFPMLMAWLAASALCGSVAIVLLLGLRPLIRRWIGARAVHALWVVVLLRLLIPWTPPTPMAVLPAPAENRFAMDSVKLRSFVVAGDREQRFRAPIASEPRPESRAVVSANSVGLIWLAGAASVFGFSLAGALRASPLVRRARRIAAESGAMSVLAALPISVRGLRILETDELKSPALCGWMRPAILLPPGWAERMAPEELRCVLMHEIGHHRRGDVLWRWLFLLTRAIHWFNPLVWMAERALRIDQEMACDEWVLAHDGCIDAGKYGEALLRACRNLSPLRIASPGHSTMAESSAGLARRIRQIARMKTHGWPALAGTVALATALCVIGPSSGTAQNPARVSDESPRGPAVPSTPASTASSTPTPLPDAKAKDGVTSGTSGTPSPAPASAAKAKEPQIEIEASFVQRPENVLKDLAGAPPGGAARPDPVWVLEDPQLQVLVRALKKTKGVDFLHAPRVTCKSGQTAVMEVIRELRFPTEYLVENDGTGRATPTAFETRNVGITLQVVPSVSAGGRIDMKLMPSVVEFDGFVNYGAGRPRRQTLKGDALTELMKNPSARHQILQPIFNTRTISTSASIQSGQTVIVGGVGGFDGADAPGSLTEWEKDFYQRSRAGANDGAPKKDGGKTMRSGKTAEERSQKYLIIFVSARILAP